MISVKPMRSFCVLGLVALAAAGCASGEQAAGPSPSSDSTSTSTSSSAQGPQVRELADGTCRSPGQADRSSASSTAATAAAIMYCWDSTMDRTQTASALRARSLMSAKFAATVKEPERNGNQAQWVKAGAHEAYSVPTVKPTPGDANEDVASDKAIRSFNVSWTWKGRDSQSVPGGMEQVVYYLEKHGSQWQIVGYSVNYSEDSKEGSS